MQQCKSGIADAALVRRAGVPPELTIAEVRA